MKITVSQKETVLYEQISDAEGVVNIPVKNDSKENAVQTVFFQLPIIDIQALWYPECEEVCFNIPWVLDVKSNGTWYFPFLSYMNADQKNTCSVYSDLWQQDLCISSRVNQRDACFNLRVQIALEPGAEGTVRLDFRRLPWQDIVADCRNLIYKGKTPVFPAGAWEPVFCTWYAVHAAVDEAWIDANAPLMADFGFKTLIVDDGWCFDEKKRVTPETIVNWYENIGNWTLSKVKFPSYKEHRERIRKLGLKYLFWTTPFFVGAKADFRHEYPNCTVNPLHEGSSVLNIYDTEAGEELKRRVVRVMKDLDLDGLKIDFLDTLGTDLERPVGRLVTDYVRDLTDQVKAVKPDALIEFRQRYATPGMAQYGTQFRAMDVPFDFLRNFTYLCNIRVCMGDCVPVHADPMYWNENDLPENIARHMIASLAGVPMLSMDLTTMPDRIKALLRRWLKFYSNHRDTLNSGAWKIVYANGPVSYASVTKGDQKIIISRETVLPPEALEGFHGTCRILNLAGNSIRLDGAEVFDCFGNKAPAGIILPGAEGILVR